MPPYRLIRSILLLEQKGYVALTYWGGCATKPILLLEPTYPTYLIQMLFTLMVMCHVMSLCNYRWVLSWTPRGWELRSSMIRPNSGRLLPGQEIGWSMMLPPCTGARWVNYYILVLARSSSIVRIGRNDIQPRKKWILATDMVPGEQTIG